MDPFAKFNGTNNKSRSWEIPNLNPAPDEEWRRLREFLSLNQQDIQAMLETVDSLFRRGPELVVGTYDHLLQNSGTAAILGWERGADPDHLAERRRFFTVWLARTLGLDFSDDFAYYLFRAGQLHAGHGPRATHVPEMYVTGSVSLVNATFARFLAEEMPGAEIIPAALAAWNKVLSMHLNMMLMGYRSGRILDEGDFPVKVSLFGQMRSVTHREQLTVQLSEGSSARTLLQKFFNYYPQARQDVFDIGWVGGERLAAGGTPWFEAIKIHQIKPMWRVLLNGKDLSYIGGPQTMINSGDEVSIFPPGR
jgi:molybdopterin converting factor small subunit